MEVPGQGSEDGPLLLLLVLFFFSRVTPVHKEMPRPGLKLT